MIQIAIGLYGLQDWFKGDFASVVDLVRMADARGIDQVSITDHVIMGENVDKYPYGRFPSGMEYPWYEPLSQATLGADGVADLEGTLAGVAELEKIGVIMSELFPYTYCRAQADLDAFFGKIAAFRAARA